MKGIIKSVLPRVLIEKVREYRKKKQHYKAIKTHFGDNVHCPICKFSFKKFESHGLTPRQNARCLNCGSLERHRLLYLYLINELDLSRNSQLKRILHFAPQKTFYQIFDSLKNKEYVPCDLLPLRYDFKGGSPVQEVDITAIPFEAESFDFILCNHVLEHVEKDSLAMKELYRVLEMKGIALLQVPVDDSRESTYEDNSITKPKERQKAFGQSDHVRLYGRDFARRLCNVGFKVDEIDYCAKFSKSEIYKYGLLSSEKIYACTK